MSDRPKVGPADPETRRKLLREKLDSERSDRAEERNQDTLKAGAAARAKRKGGKGTTLGALLDPKKSRERTVEGENTSISEAVRKGVEMGSEKKRK